ncbi:putative proteasome-type protease [Methylophaga frappieri]|uniref:Putative proteasome-type protease n=1 Tax=Methylophaga frappieri (strain ATCC BAA-2434 / DSM 25690 / JAM7) TaxID=754477 RepID=I1YJX0_METFJ|nr:proteasome-type protease [Methylophaga frappieri]AFJ03213.1 putative proteasome-type protease [Methylophaga frappieri]
MTYCVAISLDDGLVLTSDSRTNAGIDQVSTYSKMFTFETDPNRSLVLLSAGNLATTQYVAEQLKRDIRETQPRNLNTLSYLSDAADYVGEILSSRIRRHADNEASGFAPEATLILAGQIHGNPHQAFLIYPQGNHITTSQETPYLQIGESKYGKPVLDRFIRPHTSLADAATCALISMDSTMQSNVSVGPPIEVLIYRKDTFDVSKRYRFHAEHPYLIELRKAWGERLRQAFCEMPRFNEQ